jgi:5-methylcytosine-specific restriction endonuclease McrA
MANETENAQSRTPLSKKLRFEVFKRDGFKCQYCGGHPPDKILEVDHIDPVANGGSDDETNLITACFDCNRGKAARLLSDIPRSLADRASEIAEREEQVAGYEAIMRAFRARLDKDGYQILGKFCKHFDLDGIPKDNFESIKRFIDSLGLHEVILSCDSAIAKQPYYYNTCFKYFCGICWGKLRNRWEGKRS